MTRRDSDPRSGVSMAPSGAHAPLHRTSAPGSSSQGALFEAPAAKPWQSGGVKERIENIPAEDRFDGSTYDPDEDAVRLTGQLLAVFDLMKDGLWRPLRLIAHEVGGSETGVAARLRDLRKPRYGQHSVRRKREANGLFLYRLEVRG